MISAPSDFNHITHMGPGEGIEFQHLIDLQQAQKAVSGSAIGPRGQRQMVQQQAPVMRSSSAGQSVIHSVNASNMNTSSSNSVSVAVKLPPPRPLSNHGKSKSSCF